jgi:lipid-A-disaccharide synthase-like uncharacterized protein
MNHTVWLIIGFTGHAFFAMRFVVQWLYSERHRRSLVPTTFWYFSLVGGAILLSYAIYKRDPVFIVGQAMGLFIYMRFLYLARLEGTSASPHEPEPNHHN